MGVLPTRAIPGLIGPEQITKTCQNYVGAGVPELRSSAPRAHVRGEIFLFVILSV